MLSVNFKICYSILRIIEKEQIVQKAEKINSSRINKDPKESEKKKNEWRCKRKAKKKR